jgi:hypothetical protein
MTFRKTPGRDARVELFIASAQKYLGYSSELLGRTFFGQKVGYDATVWSGAFVDVIAREAEVRLPSFTYSAAGLAECIRRGNFSRSPQVGDVAVFNFSSASTHAASAFSSPHCGIVTDVREFQDTGRFITVEGNTTGTGKYSDKDGVHQKVRTINDVVLFCRPDFNGEAQQTGRSRTFNEWLTRLLDRARTKFDGSDLEEITKAASMPSVLKLNGEIKYGDRNKKIELIQLALAVVTDLRGCEPGKWDQVTAAACSRFQRNIGRVGQDVTGLPDMQTLQRLSKETGLFSV